METLFIPNEDDFKRWIKEAIKECIQDFNKREVKDEEGSGLFNRKEIATLLRISLVTLTDWMKRGLPYHKQRGRVYFVKSEVLNYIKKNKMSQMKFGSKLQHLS